MDSFLDLPVKLEWKDQEGNEISILHALLVLKGLNKDGEEVDTVMHTPDLSLSNALGLARFGLLFVEDSVRKQLKEENES